MAETGFFDNLWNRPIHTLVVVCIFLSIITMIINFVRRQYRYTKNNFATKPSHQIRKVSNIMKGNIIRELNKNNQYNPNYKEFNEETEEDDKIDGKPSDYIRTVSNKIRNSHKINKANKSNRYLIYDEDRIPVTIN